MEARYLVQERLVLGDRLDRGNSLQASWVDLGGGTRTPNRNPVTNGGWSGGLALACSLCTTIRSAAPRFAMFEAWASRLPASGDFPVPQLRLLRFVHPDETGLVGNPRTDVGTIAEVARDVFQATADRLFPQPSTTKIPFRVTNNRKRPVVTVWTSL